MNIHPIQSFTNTFNRYQNKDIETIEQKDSVEKIEVIEQKERNISKEEAAMLLYQYKSTQTMKDEIDTLFDKEEDDEDIDIDDYRELKKSVNRSNFLDAYGNEKEKNYNNSPSFVLYI